MLATDTNYQSAGTVVVNRARMKSDRAAIFGYLDNVDNVENEPEWDQPAT